MSGAVVQVRYRFVSSWRTAPLPNDLAEALLDADVLEARFTITSRDASGEGIVTWVVTVPCGKVLNVHTIAQALQQRAQEQRIV